MRKAEEKFGMVLFRNLAGVLAIVWMCIIFAFSAQPKEESGVVSASFTYHMVSSTRTFFHLNLSDARVKEISDAIEGLIRKAAHMVEFGIYPSFFTYGSGSGKWAFRAGVQLPSARLPSMPPRMKFTSSSCRDVRGGFPMCVLTVQARWRE